MTRTLTTPLPTAPRAKPARRPTTLLFAYGATLNPEHIMVRLCQPKPVAVARLADFSLGFHGYSAIWDSGQETLVDQPGAETWGVVYQLSPTELDRFDAWQGVKLDGGGSYFHYPAEVIAADGTTFDVLFHRKTEMGPPRPPSRDYLDFIVAGARARGLPGDHIEMLGAIESVPPSYPVPMAHADIKALASKLSCAC
ncbi:gamma-glutamylcyclotransferase family protein [Rhodopseudomonas telluris]|uniref:Gamma-glutamylcyclotransferase family protein n=1 Tax=Rhodopseudomonas telluris TaxID=644215 RepID=A0ABV6EKW9_9BRAD